eukprot:Gb_04549 [translate_table: standard]
MEFSNAFYVLSVILLLLGGANAKLSSRYYDESCPDVNSIVYEVVKKAVSKEPRMAGGLLRLHFHDCFVNGCDGSVLLDNSSTFTSEKYGGPNFKSARGFGVIDMIKKSVENKCKATVSCADILAIAARDSVVLTGGPSWTVMLGRRDSTTASLQGANSAIPAPTDSLSTIIKKFKDVGLSTKDLVALSGAHTIGRARCTTIRSRLYNFGSTNSSDPTLDSSYLQILQNKCPQNGVGGKRVALDPATKDIFDNKYFTNLRKNKGLFQSDQELHSTPGAATASLVKIFSSSQNIFFSSFGKSMQNMGNINPLTGNSGEIRINCRVVNN